MAKDKILKEITKLKKCLKRSEREVVCVTIENIEDIVSSSGNITLQSICAISELLRDIIYEVDNVRAHKVIVNILVVLIREMKNIKNENKLVSVTAQLKLDNTMVALDIFIAKLIERIGGY